MTSGGAVLFNGDGVSLSVRWKFLEGQDRGAARVAGGVGVGKSREFEDNTHGGVGSKVLDVLGEVVGKGWGDQSFGVFD